MGVFLSACRGGAEADGTPVRVVVPAGAHFRQVVDTLQARGILASPRLFRAYAKFKGLDASVRAGQYELVPGQDFESLLRDLTEGRVVTVPITIPEGLTLQAIAGRLAMIVNQDSLAILATLKDSVTLQQFSLPGPTLEGYLFPETYRFAQGVSLGTVVETMVETYQGYWTEERETQRMALDLSKGAITTLASIIQAEARYVEEMPRISSVYHNRIKQGMLLQADPTVLYALGGYRARLLFAAIDSVEDSPYNTYTQPGLPPGPIGAPGAQALDAALNPNAEPFLYFVARPDGTHIFSRTLREHNNAIIQARRERARTK